MLWLYPEEEFLAKGTEQTQAEGKGWLSSEAWRGKHAQ